MVRRCRSIKQLSLCVRAQSCRPARFKPCESVPRLALDVSGRGDIELFARRVFLWLPFARISVSDVVFLAGAELPRTDERLKAVKDFRPRADAEFFYRTVGLAFLFVNAPDAIDEVAAVRHGHS